MPIDVSALTPQQQATAFYVAYFDRAPDPTGLQFWITALSGGTSLSDAAAFFASGPEAQGAFPFLAAPQVSSATTFINTIYQNLFNRAPDNAGFTFWSQQLESGAVAPGDFILAILAGAQDGTPSQPGGMAGPNDMGAIMNKLSAAAAWSAAASQAGFQSFVSIVDGAVVVGNQDVYNSATSIIEGVTADATSVTAAAATISAFFGAGGGAVTGQTFTLTTTAGEAISGTAGDDTINSTVDVAGLGATPPVTLNTTDRVDGGAGFDTVNITSTSGVAPVPTGVFTNVERVNLIADTLGDGFAAGTANVSNFGGVQQLWQIGASQVVTGLTDAVTAGFNATPAASVALAAGATTANIALVNAGPGSNMFIAETDVGSLSTININGSLNGNLAIDLDAGVGTATAATSEDTLNLGITTNATITLTSSQLTVLDASTSTGNMTLGGTATIMTLSGGSGNDVLTGSTASTAINGNAGADAITAGNIAANEVINGGANGTGTGNVFDAINLGAGGVAQIVLTEAGHSGLSAATIDEITNFVSAEDKLDFNLAAGSATNFLDGGSSSGITDALTNANTAFNGTVQYYATLVGADTYVFVDNDLDGTADMGLQLIGTAAIVAGDIIA